MPRPRTNARKAPERREVILTRGALLGFAIFTVCIILGAGFAFWDARNLEQERQERRRQINQAFLTNCRNREREVAAINKRIGLPPTGVNCRKLPVFNK